MQLTCSSTARHNRPQQFNPKVTALWLSTTLWNSISSFVVRHQICQVHLAFQRPQTMASLPLLSPPSTELDGERNTTHYHSAWGTEPPVEYLPSESTTELVDFKSSRNSGDIIGTDRPTAWHPKLTLYRLVVIFSTVGLGVAKDVTSYLNLTYASITLEWILGVVLFLV